MTAFAVPYRTRAKGPRAPLPVPITIALALHWGFGTFVAVAVAGEEPFVPDIRRFPRGILYSAG